MKSKNEKVKNIQGQKATFNSVIKLLSLILIPILIIGSIVLIVFLFNSANNKNVITTKKLTDVKSNILENDSDSKPKVVDDLNRFENIRHGDDYLNSFISGDFGKKVPQDMYKNLYIVKPFYVLMKDNSDDSYYVSYYSSIPNLNISAASKNSNGDNDFESDEDVYPYLGTKPVKLKFNDYISQIINQNVKDFDYLNYKKNQFSYFIIESNCVGWDYRALPKYGCYDSSAWSTVDFTYTSTNKTLISEAMRTVANTGYDLDWMKKMYFEHEAGHNDPTLQIMKNFDDPFWKEVNIQQVIRYNNDVDKSVISAKVVGLHRIRVTTKQEGVKIFSKLQEINDFMAKYGYKNVTASLISNDNNNDNNSNNGGNKDNNQENKVKDNKQNS